MNTEISHNEILSVLLLNSDADLSELKLCMHISI